MKGPNKEVRCINCNNVIAKGNIKEGVIEIQCKTCKTLNTIEAGPVQIQPYGDRLRYQTK